MFSVSITFILKCFFFQHRMPLINENTDVSNKDDSFRLLYLFGSFRLFYFGCIIKPVQL